MSKSKIEFNDEEGIFNFRGEVSDKNNGGFTSVLANVKNVGGSPPKGAILRVKGDGNNYGLQFRTNRHFDGYA